METQPTRTEELKMFIFSITNSIKADQSGSPSLKRAFIAVSFSFEEAANKFQQDYANQPGVIAESLGSLTISTLQTMIPSLAIKKEEKTLNSIEMPLNPLDDKAKFVAGLKLGADRFLTNEKDKSIMLKLIEKIV